MALYSDPRLRRVRYEQLAGKMISDRQGGGFDGHWRELGDWTMPRRTRFWTGEKNRTGVGFNRNIINSTARFSARTLSSGLHAGLTSPARPWMKLTTHDPQLAKRKNVATWLHDVSSRMLTLFATTNLYNVLPLVYLDMGIFATAGMAIVPDKRDLFRCFSYPIGSFAIAQDDRGKTSTFTREYELSVEQIVEQFGVLDNGRDIDWSRISNHVKSLWDSGDYQQSIPLVWMVKRNEQADARKLASKYLPFSSCYWEKGNEERIFLKESGYNNFPIMAPRWDITGEDSYGTDSPGMIALGDIKQLQIMERRKGQAIAKFVDPALKGPSSLRKQKTSLLPGDVTYVDVREGMQGLAPIHEIRLEGVRFLSDDAHGVEYRIQRAFYEDLFLMLARSDDGRGQQPATAREIDERHEEKLLALGPVLERTNDELLDPIVDRTFSMMVAANMIPPPPQELQGVRLKVEYISILSQAQKLVGVTGQDRFLQTTLGLAEVYPQVRNKVNVNKVVNNYADMLGVDPEIVYSDEQADATTQQQAQAAQEAQDAETAQKVAKAARDASQAPVTGDSALNAMVTAAGRGNQIPAQASGSAPVQVPAA